MIERWGKFKSSERTSRISLRDYALQNPSEKTMHILGASLASLKTLEQELLPSGSQRKYYGSKLDKAIKLREKNGFIMTCPQLSADNIFITTNNTNDITLEYKNTLKRPTYNREDILLNAARIALELEVIMLSKNQSIPVAGNVNSLAYHFITGFNEQFDNTGLSGYDIALINQFYLSSAAQQLYERTQEPVYLELSQIHSTAKEELLKENIKQAFQEAENSTEELVLAFGPDSKQILGALPRELIIREKLGRLVAINIITRNNGKEFLIQTREGTGYRDKEKGFPGEHAQKGETIRRTAEREAFEEEKIETSPRFALGIEYTEGKELFFARIYVSELKNEVIAAGKNFYTLKKLLHQLNSGVIYTPLNAAIINLLPVLLEQLNIHTKVDILEMLLEKPKRGSLISSPTPIGKIYHNNYRIPLFIDGNVIDSSEISSGTYIYSRKNRPSSIVLLGSSVYDPGLHIAEKILLPATDKIGVYREISSNAIERYRQLIASLLLNRQFSEPGVYMGIERIYNLHFLDGQVIYNDGGLYPSLTTDLFNRDPTPTDIPPDISATYGLRIVGLPPNCELSYLLQTLSDKDLEPRLAAINEKIIEMHLKPMPVDPGIDWGSPKQLWQKQIENLKYFKMILEINRELEIFPQKDLEKLVLLYVNIAYAVFKHPLSIYRRRHYFDKRIQAGAIAHHHGDLNPGNIFSGEKVAYPDSSKINAEVIDANGEKKEFWNIDRLSDLAMYLIGVHNNRRNPELLKAMRNDYFRLAHANNLENPYDPVALAILDYYLFDKAGIALYMEMLYKIYIKDPVKKIRDRLTPFKETVEEMVNNFNPLQ